MPAQAITSLAPSSLYHRAQPTPLRHHDSQQLLATRSRFHVVPIRAPAQQVPSRVCKFLSLSLSTPSLIRSLVFVTVLTIIVILEALCSLIYVPVESASIKQAISSAPSSAVCASLTRLFSSTVKLVGSLISENVFDCARNLIHISCGFRAVLFCEFCFADALVTSPQSTHFHFFSRFFSSNRG